jgi:hypothetical protein
LAEGHGWIEIMKTQARPHGAGHNPSRAPAGSAKRLKPRPRDNACDFVYDIR